MATISGIDEITTRTLDGLSSIDVDTIIINGQPFDPTDYLNKLTDTSDDIVEGIAQLFLTPTERSDIAANTAARHSPVTIGTANGLTIGGTSGQELSLAIADGTTTGALSNADWVTFNGKQDPITVSTPLTFIANNVAIPQASAVQDGYLSATDFAAFASGGAWSVNTAPNPDVVYLTNTSNSVAIGATTVPSSAVRLFVNGTAQASDIYASSSISTENVYVGALSVITSDPVQIRGDVRIEAGNVFVGGSGNFSGMLSVLTNGANSRFIGGDHVYQEFYPRGVAAGRQGIIGYSGAGSTVLAIANNETNNIVSLQNRVGINTSTVPTNYHLNLRGNMTMGIYSDNFGSRYVGINEQSTGTGGNFLAGMEIENTTLGGNYSQRVHLSTHRFASSYGRRLTVTEDGQVIQANGANSLTTYGPTPNAGWNASFCVGAGSGDHTAAKQGALVVTNGNVHLDVARDSGYDLYFNYYTSAASSDNKRLLDYSQQHYFGSAGAGGTNRTFRAATPIQSIIKHYLPVSGGLYNTFVNAWVRMLPGVFEVSIQPLRQTDYYKIRVKLSVCCLQLSSVAFRVMRLIGGAASGVFSLGTAGVNQGHSRTAPSGGNEPGYWMNPPVYIEVWDYPNTQQTLTYYVEYMTYSPAYGFQLNYVTIGGQGGDATGVISTICVEQYEYSVINN